MDVNLEVDGGISITIRVDLFDKVRDIKEKVQNHLGIPISKQTLVFNGQVVQDHLEMWSFGNGEELHIQLLVSPDSANPVTQPLPPPMTEDFLSTSEVLALLMDDDLPPPPQSQPMPVLPLPQTQPMPALPPPQTQSFPALPPPQSQPMAALPPPQSQPLPALLPPHSQLIPGLWPPQSQPLVSRPRAEPAWMYDSMRMSELQPVPAFPQSLPPTRIPSYDLFQMLMYAQQPPPARIPGYPLPPRTDMAPPRQLRRIDLPMPEMPRPLEQRRFQQPTRMEVPSAIIQLDVKTPAAKDRVPLLMDLNDTVLKLKEKILHGDDMQVTVDRIALQLHRTRAELHDHQLLRDCGVKENFEIDVYIKPPPPSSTASTAEAVVDVGGGSSSGGGEAGSDEKKLRVIVLPMRTRERIQIGVNGDDNVQVLRRELEVLQQKLQFRLPKDGGYFFIHNQKTMLEEESFRWHGVKQGDTIETFDGFLTDSPKMPSNRNYYPPPK